MLVAGLEPARYCYHGILSPGCLPIPPHEHINKTFIFGLVAFAISAIPLYLSGELRFELRSQLRPRGLVSITKNILQKKSLFLSYIYILYYIFYKKSNIIFWLGRWDSNPHSQGQSLDSCGFRDRFLTIRILPNIEDKDFFIFFILYKYYIIFF